MIEENAFSGFSGITKLVIPDSVTTIVYEAFSGCSGLKELTIGKNVEYIGYEAFLGCKELTKIYFKGTREPDCYYEKTMNACGANPFCVYLDSTGKYIPTDIIVYVPEGYVKDYDGFCKLTDVRENQ